MSGEVGGRWVLLDTLQHPKELNSENDMSLEGMGAVQELETILLQNCPQRCVQGECCPLGPASHRAVQEPGP